jgi:hypothetical protein
MPVASMTGYGDHMSSTRRRYPAGRRCLLVACSSAPVRPGSTRHADRMIKCGRGIERGLNGTQWHCKARGGILFFGSDQVISKWLWTFNPQL